jgi:hypothetical protein
MATRAMKARTSARVIARVNTWLEEVERVAQAL